MAQAQPCRQLLELLRRYQRVPLRQHRRRTDSPDCSLVSQPYVSRAMPLERDANDRRRVYPAHPPHHKLSPAHQRHLETRTLSLLFRITVHPLLLLQCLINRTQHHILPGIINQAHCLSRSPLVNRQAQQLPCPPPRRRSLHRSPHSPHSRPVRQ